MLPDICTTSCLRGQFRSQRFECHLESLESLVETFPDLRIGALCSGYSDQELRSVRSLGVKVKSWEFPTYKHLKQNWVLKRLYKEKCRSVCLLDDDVVFVAGQDIIKSFLNSPEGMQSPCYFCAPTGTFYSGYLQKGDSQVVQCPLAIPGWMVLARSDLKVVYDSDLIIYDDGRAMPDDTALRYSCGVEGKEVLLDKRIQMKTVSKERQSIFAPDRQLRNELIEHQRKLVIDRYPYLLHLRGRHYNFVWKSRYAKQLLRDGLLRRTQFGLQIKPGNDDRLRQRFPSDKFRYEPPKDRQRRRKLEKGKRKRGRDWLGCGMNTESHQINAGVRCGLSLADVMDVTGLSHDRVEIHFRAMVKNGWAESDGNGGLRLLITPDESLSVSNSSPAGV